MIARLLILLLTAHGAVAQSITGMSRIAPSAQLELRDAKSLSVATDGTLYVADTGHHRVVAIDSMGRLAFETGGFGREHGQFQWPRKVVADRGVAIWVLDYGNRRIEKFSRSLEYQGTFRLAAEDAGASPQIEEFAISPQGDLYLYDRDGGRLMRFDPLFRAQAELGQNRGAEFVSSVSRMVFVPNAGLVWWERNSDVARLANPFLTQVQNIQLSLSEAGASIVLSVLDSCLVSGDRQLLRSWCDTGAPPDTMFSLVSHPDLRLTRLDDIAFAGRGVAYVLDGAAGAIYRVSLAER